MTMTVMILTRLIYNLYIIVNDNIDRIIINIDNTHIARLQYCNYMAVCTHCYAPINMMPTKGSFMVNDAMDWRLGL